MFADRPGMNLSNDPATGASQAECGLTKGLDESAGATASCKKCPKILLRRLLLLVGGAFVFALVASVIRPGDSRASLATNPLVNEDGRIGSVSAQLAKLPHPMGWPCLGLLRGTSQLIVIHGSPSGARYSVYTLSGRIVSADLSSDEVYREFPDLDIEGLRLDPGNEQGPLMLYTPRE